MKNNYYKRALGVLAELGRTHPSYSIGRHIDTAFADYGSLWGISDKEFLFALEKYQTQLSLDTSDMAPDEYVYLIQKDAEKLFDTPLDAEEEEF